MHIRVIGLGSNWWDVNSGDTLDPFCFRRRVAWFNSAGLKSGRRLRLCWVYPGHIRFNQSSGFDPEHPMRSLGKTFLSKGPVKLSGRTHLLLSRDARAPLIPDRYLVTVRAHQHGHISFVYRGWMSDGAQPISVSLRGSSFEAMLLLGQEDWIKTDVGTWVISLDGQRLVLETNSTRRLS